MQCTQTTWLSDVEYLRQFNEKVVQGRIPLFGSIDLTYQCNLRCVHCYLGDKGGMKGRPGEELSTAQWTDLIDEITEAGCLYLLITGGEPLVRKDFPLIYRHARESGLLVTVFTNGTLITDRLLDLFDELPPHVVDITVYGATSSTYEKITGVRGSYEKCLKGIQRLLDHEVNVTLKTVIMTLNQHEVFDIEDMATSYGVRFRSDPAVFPCLDGDKTPLGFRLTPQEAVAVELSDAERLRQWRDVFEKFRDVPMTDDLYQCGAGRSMFHVDPYGSLRPCVMVGGPKYDLLSGSFLVGWDDVISTIGGKKAGADAHCRQCDKKVLCGYCPGFFELESGSENVHSPFLCAIGHYRFQAIQDVDL
ncbi:MAG: radical SAM protein [Thermodesulfobacteriota bacterium]|nr:radical SAM protein [Thermodesulfobacteriota bacterium]